MIKRPIEFKIRGEVLCCSDIDAIDYYGEFRGNNQYICPELEKWAADNNCYWEWENCEEICLAS